MAETPFRADHQARSLLSAKRPADAARVLGQALASHPNDPGLHCLLAQALLGMDDPTQALREAETAASLSPEDEWPHRLRSLALRGVGRKREALQAAREAVQLAPREPMAHRVLGDALLDVGQVGAARQSAEELAVLAPEWVGTFDLLGRVALRQRQAVQAEGHFRRGLAIEPENATLLNNLGVALGMQRKTRAAIDAYHQAARLNPSFELARRNLKRSTAHYIGAAGVGSGLIAIALIQVASRFSLSGSHASGRSAVLPLLLFFAACALIFIGLGWLRRRRLAARLAELDHVIQQFYKLEGTRDPQAAFRPYYAAGTLFLGAVVLLVIFLEPPGDTTGLWIAVALLLAWVLTARRTWRRLRPRLEPYLVAVLESLRGRFPGLRRADP